MLFSANYIFYSVGVNTGDIHTSCLLVPVVQYVLNVNLSSKVFSFDNILYTVRWS